MFKIVSNFKPVLLFLSSTKSQFMLQYSNNYAEGYPNVWDCVILHLHSHDNI